MGGDNLSLGRTRGLHNLPRSRLRFAMSPSTSPPKCARTIEPARLMAAETPQLEYRLRDLVNAAYGGPRRKSA
jgi:hypothetical protein